MKTPLLLLIGSFFALSSISQSVNLKFDGANQNRTYQVVIDGTAYNSADAINQGTKGITIPNLMIGTHTIAVYRSKANQIGTTGNAVYTNNFTLRDGYDMTISVRPTGAVSFSERRIRNRNQSNTTYKTPMGDAEFNVIYNSARSKWLQSGKITIIRDAFNNTAYNFSTSQIKSLLTLLSNQTSRLELAKLGYARVTDAPNYSQLNTLFTTQAAKDELATFISQNSTTNTTTQNTRLPMADYQFTQLLQKVNYTASGTNRFNAVRDVFLTTGYYFTTYQSRQLLNSISVELDRLYLAKLGYAKVTDPANYRSLTTLFNTQVNRDDFTNYVNSNGGAIDVYNSGQYASRIPVTDGAFNSIYASAKNHFRQSSTVAAVRDAFNTANYYTISQIRQLVGLAFSETDRLELAKLAYKRVNDPTNYSELADLLTTQASRDDLNLYITANRF